MLQAILPLIGTVIDRIIPDKNGAEKAKAEIEKTLVDNAVQLNLAQAETNKVEAGHRSTFVAGWRPMLGWTVSLSFLWIYLVAPLFAWLLKLNGIDTELPTLNVDILLELTFAMLGLAGLRTYEKQKGLTK